MGKVFTFPGVSTGVSPVMFIEALQDAGSFEIVKSEIASVCKLEDFEPEAPGPIGLVKGDMPEGTVHTIPLPDMNDGHSRTYGVVTHPNFPVALNRYTDLSAEESVGVACVYVHALGLVAAAIRSYAGWGAGIRSFRKSMDETIWPYEFAAPEQGGGIALPFRAAANIALRSSGLDSLELATEPPYMPHMASLVNPLDELEMRTLYSPLRRFALQ